MNDDIYHFEPREEKPEEASHTPVDDRLSVEQQRRILGDFQDSVKMEGRELISTVNLPVGMISFDDTIDHFVDVKRRKAEMKGDTFIWEDNSEEAIEDVEIAAMRASAIARLSTLEVVDGSVIQDILVDHISRFGPLKIQTEQHREILRYILKHKTYEIDIQTMIMRFRQVSVGNFFEFESKCWNCGHVGKYKVRISDMKVEWPEGEEDGLSSKPVRQDEITRLGITIKFEWRWNTTGDTQRVSNIIKKFEELGRSDEITSLLMIVALGRLRKVWLPVGSPGEDGVQPYKEHVLYYEQGNAPEDRSSIVRDPVKFIQDLPGWFFMEMVKIINEKEPGIDFKVEIECEACKSESAFMLNPTERAFFTPSVIADS